MNDDSLKREIEEALAVEPSPEFSSRVRQRIADQRAKRSARWPWKVWAPALAMAVVAIAVLLYRPAQGPAPVQPERIAVAAPPEVPVPVPAPAPKPPSPSTLKAPSKAPALKKALLEPEVLIDPRETAAFRSFLNGIQQQRIDPSILEALFEAAEKSRSAAIETMPVAGLEPIVIPPVTVPEKEGGSL
jgi:hypothetical protein